MTDHTWDLISIGGEAVEVSCDALKVDGVRRTFTWLEAEAMARELGAELPTPEVLDARWAARRWHITPYPGPVATKTAEEHSAEIDAGLAILGYDGTGIVGNVGKHWCRSEGPGQFPLYGWHLDGTAPTWRGIKLHPTRSGIAARVIQPYAPTAHPGGTHRDYSMTLVLVRRAPGSPPGRPTLRRGSTGPDVAAVQRIVGATADGVYGAGTERAVRIWQATRGLAADGVFGPRSWAASLMAPVEVREPLRLAPGDLRAPACVAALRDADARWPTRRRQSDGILGDAAHQRRPSDHNLGNAVDITHDVASGCVGQLLSEIAVQDDRVTYVIWQRRIYSRSRAAEGWRPYAGKNPHTAHVHISVRADRREDARPWAWAAG